MIHRVLKNKKLVHSLLTFALGSNLLFNFNVLNGPKDPTVRFGDLASIFRASICYEKIGLNVYYGPVNDCGYIYGRFFLELMDIFNLGNFGLRNLIAIGVFQGVSLIGVLLFLLWTLNKFENGIIPIAAVMLFSPGVLFLIERGNLDIIMILLITLSFSLYGKNNFLSWSFLALSASFKFYSVPLLLLSSVLQKSIRTRLFLLVLSIALTVTLTVDLLKFKITFPSSLFLGFGAPLVPGWINLLLSHQDLINSSIVGSVGYLISTLLVVMLGLLFKKHIQFKQKLTPINDGNGLLFAFLFSATIYMSCYFTGFSYDIRLIYLAVCTSILITITQSSKLFKMFVYSNAFAAFWIGAQIGINFSSFQKLNVVLQAVGDVSILILTSMVLVVFVKGIDLLMTENWSKWKLATRLILNRNWIASHRNE